jgi:hypothetical protein
MGTHRETIGVGLRSFVLVPGSSMNATFTCDTRHKGLVPCANVLSVRIRRLRGVQDSKSKAEKTIALTLSQSSSPPCISAERPSGLVFVYSSSYLLLILTPFYQNSREIRYWFAAFPVLVVVLPPAISELTYYQ